MKMLEKLKDWLSRHVTSVVTPLLLLYQSIPVVGFMGLMLFPIATYVFSLAWEMPNVLDFQVRTLFLSRELMLGRIIALAGFIFFLAGLVSLLKGQGDVVATKLYSVVRHPQYLGFIIMTWGISIMCVQHMGLIRHIPHSWFLMALAYVLLACYEEWYLLKKHAKEYQEYRRKVPFIFPIPHPPKIPQPLFTMVIVLVFAFSMTFFGA